MYLTAHRVHKEGASETGVNAFYYRHGPAPLDIKASRADEDMDTVVFENPGTLARRHENVAPGGNIVPSSRLSKP